MIKRWPEEALAKIKRWPEKALAIVASDREGVCGRQRLGRRRGRRDKALDGKASNRKGVGKIRRWSSVSCPPTRSSLYHHGRRPVEYEAAVSANAPSTKLLCRSCCRCVPTLEPAIASQYQNSSKRRRALASTSSLNGALLRRFRSAGRLTGGLYYRRRACLSASNGQPYQRRTLAELTVHPASNRPRCARHAVSNQSVGGICMTLLVVPHKIGRLWSKIVVRTTAHQNMTQT